MCISLFHSLSLSIYMLCLYIYIYIYTARAVSQASTQHVLAVKTSDEKALRH